MPPVRRRARPSAAPAVPARRAPRARVRPYSARVADSELATAIAVPYVAAGAVALWLIDATQPLRDAVRGLVALTPVWPGWWALAVLIGSWYVAVAVARRIGPQGWHRPVALIAAFAVLVAAVTVASGAMGW